MKRSTLALVAVLVVVAVSLHLAVSWQDFAVLAKNGFLYDDSFYAFQIARNVAEGNGPTFDGATYTNGYQPLYVALLVPIYLLFPSDPILPVHAGLTLLALFTVLTALLLFLTARRYVSDTIAVFVAFVWAVSPIVIKQSANGLETALALFLFACSVYYYLDRIRSRPAPPRLAFFKLGLLLGLAALARVDEVFLALAMALDYLVTMRKRGAAPVAVLKNVGSAAGTAFLVYLPWMVYGVVAVGSPLQESCAATRFLSIAYAPFFDVGSSDLAADGPSVSFIWSHIVHSISILKMAPPVHVVFRAVEKAGQLVGLDGPLRLAMNVLGLAALAGFVLAAVRWRRKEGKGKRGELDFLVLFAVLLIVAYSLYVFGMFFFSRYYYPIYFITAVFAACLISDAVAWVRRRSALVRGAAVGVSAFYLACLVYMGYTAGFRTEPVYHFYDVALWIEENTGETETIGVFQGGVIGYLSHRHVVNLDGKVNKYALEALKHRTMREYIEKAGIDVIMDHEVVLNLFLGRKTGAGRANITSDKIFAGYKIGVPGWSGYRLSSAQRRNTGAFFSLPRGPDSHD